MSRSLGQLPRIRAAVDAGKLTPLAGESLIEVTNPAPRGRVTDRHLLRQVLDGLHAL